MALDFSKYGTPVQAPASSGGLDFAKYGAPAGPSVGPAPAPQPAPSFSAFGHPVQDINAAGADVHDAITAEGAYQGKNFLERGFAAASSAAGAIPTVVADVIPGGKPVLDAAGKIASAGINAFGNSSGYLADAAQKVGLMTPEQRTQYDANNAAFAGSPLGHAIESTASIGESSGNIANVLLGAHGSAEATQAILDNTVPKLKEALQKKVEDHAAATPPEAITKQQQLVSKTADEIKSLEDKYQTARNANDYAKDGGQASRERIAQSGVLKYTVDENGLLRTTDPGGPVDQYKAMTVKPAEGVVRKALEQEGSKVNLSDAKSKLIDEVKASGLKGADLVTALNSVEREIEGLRLDADSKGYVPTTALQDAKINTTSNINFQTPPEIGTYRKAVARAYKSLIEEHSTFNVKEVNAELGKYYDDIARLERLDGRRVTGGRLGKYTAQIGGSVVGGLAGSLLGPFGSIVGGIAGGEVSGFLKGKSFQRTFSNASVPEAPQSEILKKAVEQTSTPTAP